LKKVFVILTLLVASVQVQAQTQYELSPAGLTPNDGLTYWWFDRGWEPIEVWFAGAVAWVQGRDVAEARALKCLDIAEERVAEIYVVVQIDRSGFVGELSQNYESWLGEARLIASQIPNATTVYERVALATSIHEVVLEGVLEEVPEEAKPSVQRALEESQTGKQEALSALEDAGKDSEVYKQEIDLTVAQWVENREKQRP